MFKEKDKQEKTKGLKGDKKWLSLLCLNGSSLIKKEACARRNVTAKNSSFSAFTPAHAGFTLAEVLITLTIIGVVAALTIPSLLSNVSDKTYNSKRKGLQTRLAQALSQMDNLNTYEDTSSEANAIANSSMNFVVDGLSKAYKITNVCEFENFAACDFPISFGRWFDSGRYYTKDYPNNGMSGLLTPAKTGGISSKAVAFKSRNGESFILWYFPRCIAEQDVQPGGEKNWTKEVCALFAVDLDGGKKGPNITGKDIFYGIVLYPDTPFVLINAPDYADVDSANQKPSYSSTGDNAEKFCTTLEMYNLSKGTMTLPTKERQYLILAMYTGTGNLMWTGSVEGSGPDDYGWMTQEQYAKLMPRTTVGNWNWCVRRDTL